VFWRAIHAGANDAAKELGAEIVWSAPAKEDDKNGQIDIVTNLINEKVDGIVLAPLDKDALVQPVDEATKAGIPVVVIDSDLTGSKNPFVATDNYKGGQMAGQEMARLLGDKGRVVMIRYQAGSASTDAREQGFKDEIMKHPGIKLVSDNQYAGSTVDSAQQKGESVLNAMKKPDGSLDFEGLYCPNESSTFGLLRVLQDNNWTRKIKFIGFDSSDDLVKGLSAGEIDGLIVQNPYRMGHDGVKTIIDVINKKNVEKKIDTGATLVTKANMEQPDIQKLLNPPNAE
jgi:ribose transport system substrate-binding protein